MGVFEWIEDVLISWEKVLSSLSRRRRSQGLREGQSHTGIPGKKGGLRLLPCGSGVLLVSWVENGPG
jgi:hypothetical protein